MTLTVKHPPADTEWKVTKSFLIDHPSTIYAESLISLRAAIASAARIANDSRPPKKWIRELSFRYEIDDQDMVNKVDVYFFGYAQRKIRFMTLERVIYA